MIFRKFFFYSSIHSICHDNEKSASIDKIAIDLPSAQTRCLYVIHYAFIRNTHFIICFSVVRRSTKDAIYRIISFQYNTTEKSICKPSNILEVKGAR